MFDQCFPFQIVLRQFHSEELKSVRKNGMLSFIHTYEYTCRENDRLNYEWDKGVNFQPATAVDRADLHEDATRQIPTLLEPGNTIIAPTIILMKLNVARAWRPWNHAEMNNEGERKSLGDILDRSEISTIILAIFHSFFSFHKTRRSILCPLLTRVEPITDLSILWPEYPPTTVVQLWNIIFRIHKIFQARLP